VEKVPRSTLTRGRANSTFPHISSFFTKVDIIKQISFVAFEFVSDLALHHMALFAQDILKSGTVT
jgi:hypothetical protein